MAQGVEIVPPPGQWAKRPKLVTVVAPVYREAAGLAQFVAAVDEVFRRIGLPYELLLVEDDSPDRSWEIIRQLQMRYPDTLRGLSLSRRFGHQASLAAGLAHARGEVVICMDSDLQHPPEILPLLLWHWSCGYQVVYTRRQAQPGRLWLQERLSRWFYRLISRASSISLEEGTADFRLMDRLVVDALNRFNERSLVFRGLINWIGFRQKAVDYVAAPRLAGRSSYSWSRLFQLASDCLFAFSLAPLKLSLFLGIAGILCGVGYLGYVLVVMFLHGADVAGYASLVTLIILLGSLNLIGLGVLGAYVGRIHEQVKDRPLYLVKEAVGFPEHRGLSSVLVTKEAA
jgi:polyisoprenyl-phosphate glycosyltransferase